MTDCSSAYFFFKFWMFESFCQCRFICSAPRFGSVVIRYGIDSTSLLHSHIPFYREKCIPFLGAKKGRTFCFPPKSHTEWTKWDLHLYPQKMLPLFLLTNHKRSKGTGVSFRYHSIKEYCNFYLATAFFRLYERDHGWCAPFSSLYTWK